MVSILVPWYLNWCHGIYIGAMAFIWVSYVIAEFTIFDIFDILHIFYVFDIFYSVDRINRIDRGYTVYTVELM